jgi:carbon storage regulator CsrA
MAAKLRALCLTRRLREKVVMTVQGVRFTVEITQINGGKIRLRFEAPDEVDIWREEVQRAIDGAEAVDNNPTKYF